MLSSTHNLFAYNVSQVANANVLSLCSSNDEQVANAKACPQFVFMQ